MTLRLSVDRKSIPGATRSSCNGELSIPEPLKAKKINALYTKNVRQITQFESSKVNLCMIMIGAMNVSSISITDKDKNIYKKGEEFARFNLGSTVLMLFSGSENIKFPDHIKFGEQIKLGECIAKFR